MAEKTAKATDKKPEIKGLNSDVRQNGPKNMIARFYPAMVTTDKEKGTQEQRGWLMQVQGDQALYKNLDPAKSGIRTRNYMNYSSYENPETHRKVQGCGSIHITDGQYDQMMAKGTGFEAPERTAADGKVNPDYVYFSGTTFPTDGKKHMVKISEMTEPKGRRNMPTTYDEAAAGWKKSTENTIGAIKTAQANKAAAKEAEAAKDAPAPKAAEKEAPVAEVEAVEVETPEIPDIDVEITAEAVAAEMEMPY